jgi:hypothetical protein
LGKAAVSMTTARAIDIAILRDCFQYLRVIGVSSLLIHHPLRHIFASETDFSDCDCHSQSIS